jgi:hypothetical protein
MSLWTPHASSGFTTAATCAHTMMDRPCSCVCCLVQTMIAMKHPHVVPLNESFLLQNHLAIVMEVRDALQSCAVKFLKSQSNASAKQHVCHSILAMHGKPVHGWNRRHWCPTGGSMNLHGRSALTAYCHCEGCDPCCEVRFFHPHCFNDHLPPFLH